MSPNCAIRSVEDKTQSLRYGFRFAVHDLETFIGHFPLDKVCVRFSNPQQWPSCDSDFCHQFLPIFNFAFTPYVLLDDLPIEE